MSLHSVCVFQEREEESKRLKQQKITEEAEQKRLAAEYEQRKNQRILREIEERELEEAQALLEEAERRRGGKKGGKKPILEGVSLNYICKLNLAISVLNVNSNLYLVLIQEKVTKQTLMERALTEQLRERQEMEKKLQKLAKTMDYMERAKREEAAPLIDAAYQRRLVEERVIHEREQQVFVLHMYLCLILHYLEISHL